MEKITQKSETEKTNLTHLMSLKKSPRGIRGGTFVDKAKEKHFATCGERKIS